MVSSRNFMEGVFMEITPVTDNVVPVSKADSLSKELNDLSPADLDKRVAKMLKAIEAGANYEQSDLTWTQVKDWFKAHTPKFSSLVEHALTIVDRFKSLKTFLFTLSFSVPDLVFTASFSADGFEVGVHVDVNPARAISIAAVKFYELNKTL